MNGGRGYLRRGNRIGDKRFVSGRCEWEVLVLGHEDRLTLAPMMSFFFFFSCFFFVKSQIERERGEGREERGANGNRETEVWVIELFCAWVLSLQTCSGTVSVGSSPSR